MLKNLNTIAVEIRTDENGVLKNQIVLLFTMLNWKEARYAQWNFILQVHDAIVPKYSQIKSYEETVTIIFWKFSVMIQKFLCLNGESNQGLSHSNRASYHQIIQTTIVIFAPPRRKCLPMLPALRSHSPPLRNSRLHSKNRNGMLLKLCMSFDNLHFKSSEHHCDTGETADAIQNIDHFKL